MMKVGLAQHISVRHCKPRVTRDPDSETVPPVIKQVNHQELRRGSDVVGIAVSGDFVPGTLLLCVTLRGWQDVAPLQRHRAERDACPAGCVRVVLQHTVGSPIRNLVPLHAGDGPSASSHSQQGKQGTAAAVAEDQDPHRTCVRSILR